MRAIIAQIKAIASHAVAYTDEGRAYRDSKLLTIRQALAEAVASVDDNLRFRQMARQERSQRSGHHAEETA